MLMNMTMTMMTVMLLVASFSSRRQDDGVPRHSFVTAPPAAAATHPTAPHPTSAWRADAIGAVSPRSTPSTINRVRFAHHLQPSHTRSTKLGFGSAEV